MLVDTHCHLDFGQFDLDRDEVVKRASDMLVVNSTVDPGGVADALRMCERYENVRLCLGFGASDLGEDRFEKMRGLIRRHKDELVGLGEVGLDYYWVKDEKERQTQKRHFTEMAELSRELDLPLVVHSRDAEADCINILEGLKVEAIMHCFSGTIKEAERAVDAGCLISIPANVTYVGSRQKIAKAVPVESIVLETDAPYLAPVKGQRNEPANVLAAAKKIAEIKGLGLEQVREATTSAAKRFFRI
jgi:TatD DNase family protein